MKKILTLLFVSLLILGCEKPVNEQVYEITVDKNQPKTFTVPFSGKDYVISFVSASEWSSEIDFLDGIPGWVNISKSTGKGGSSQEQIKVTVDANKGKADREAVVRVESGSAFVDFVFHQLFDNGGQEPGPGPGTEPGPDPGADPGADPGTDPGAAPGTTPTPDPYFEVSPNNIELGVEGGEFVIAVNSNVEHYYEVQSDWIEYLDMVVNDVESIYKFYASPNEGDDRSGLITFCGNDVCVPVSVDQNGVPPAATLEINPSQLSVDVSGTAEPVTITVYSNSAWAVQSDSEWCEVEGGSGVNDGSFNITVEPNPTIDVRVAIITVTVEDAAASRTVTVIQAPQAGETGDDAWKSKEFYHRSLVLRFTADWCGYCPQMASALNDAQQALPDKIETIAVHGGGSSLQTEASSALAGLYGITNYPTGVIDGLSYVPNSDSTKDMIISSVKETEDKYDAVSGASWTSSVSGRNVNLNLSAYIKEAGSYKITAFLLEDNVIAPQTDYKNGDQHDYVHSGIIRSAFTYPLGESFTVEENFAVKDFLYSVEVPSGSVVDNMRVIVYVQKLDEDTSRYYVDNAFSAAVGVNQSLQFVTDGWGTGNEGVKPGEDITF